jgi:hypothetical protein
VLASRGASARAEALSAVMFRSCGSFMTGSPLSGAAFTVSHSLRQGLEIW